MNAIRTSPLLAAVVAVEVAALPSLQLLQTLPHLTLLLIYRYWTRKIRFHSLTDRFCHRTMDLMTAVAVVQATQAVLAAVPEAARAVALAVVPEVALEVARAAAAVVVQEVALAVVPVAAPAVVQEAARIKEPEIAQSVMLKVTIAR